MTINTSNFGGGGLPKLAPDLTLPTNSNGYSMSTTLTGIDPSSGLTTVLSASGSKGYVTYLTLGSLISESYTIKLTVDGVVIWNGTKSVTSPNVTLIGGYTGTALYYSPVPFDSSFLLEVQSTTDSNITCNYALIRTL